MRRVEVEQAVNVLPFWACLLAILATGVFSIALAMLTKHLDVKYAIERGKARDRFFLSAFTLIFVVMTCFLSVTEKETDSEDWSALEKVLTQDGVTNTSLLMDLKELQVGAYLLSETEHIMVGRESETVYVITDLPHEEGRDDKS